MRWRTPVLLTVAVLQVGCSPQQSAMAPSGAEAERTNLLFWVMTTGGGIIFAGVLLIAALAILGYRRRFSSRAPASSFPLSS